MRCCFMLLIDKTKVQELLGQVEPNIDGERNKQMLTAYWLKIKTPEHL